MGSTEDPTTPDEGEADGRASRERDFSRRALLRAGVGLPAVLSLGALAAACGSDDKHSDAGGGSHADHTDGDAAHTDAAHADTTHNDHGDGGGGGHSDAGGATATPGRHPTATTPMVVLLTPITATRRP